MIETFAAFWALFLSAVHFAAAVAVTVHAALHKRNSRAAIGWIGLGWLAPFFGPALYLLLGINRIQRTGASLGLADKWKAAIVDNDGAAWPSGPTMGAEDISIGHSGFVGMDLLVERITGKRLSAGNAVEPLVDGDKAYPAMLQAIRSARRSIALASYIFDDDAVGRSFLEALSEARKRGVQVRVLVDAVGARYSRVRMIGLLRAEQVPAEQFLPPRGRRFFRYANLRLHRKILVVDGEIGFTGGINIRSGHLLSSDPAYPIRCLHFRVRGPVVADLLRTFAIDWAFVRGELLEGDAWRLDVSPCGGVMSRGIADGPDTDADNMQNVLLGALAAAQFRVRVATPYFLPDDALLAALKTTALRGVSVDIVLPGRSNVFVMDWAMSTLLGDLIERGCRIHLSPPPFDHAKIFTVDGFWSLVGSTNWDARSLRLNFEYNLECYDVELAAKLDALVDERIRRGRELTLAELRGRPIGLRLRDGLARLLTPYL